MRYSEAELFQLSELQTDAFWDLIIGAGPLQAYAGQMERRVVTSELPKPEFKNITAGVHGYEFEIYGTVSYKSTVTMTFVEPVDMIIAQAIDDWANQVYSRGGADVQGTQLGIHQSLYQDFDLVPSTRDDTATQRFVCRKAAINAYDPGGSMQDGNSPGIYKPTISFTVNWFTWENLGVQPG